MLEGLIARYNHATDSLRMDDWLDCWSDDAVIDGIDQCLVGKAQAKDPQMAFSDVYEDVLVKQDGRWRFKGVKMTQDKLPTV